MFFDTPNTVLDVLIGAWRAQATDVREARMCFNLQTMLLFSKNKKYKFSDAK